jgi:hypothetical protein
VYFIKGGSDVRVKGYVTDAAGTAFPLGIIDEDDVRSVKLDGFTVGSNTAINSDNSIFTAFRNTQAQLNSLSTAVAGGIKIPLPIDCSANPDYPPAAAGDSYLVTVGGKIGGASGLLVQAGDKIIAQQTNAGGNQATVGSAWYIIQGNIDLATTTTSGITRIATDTETNAGSENFAYVTPSTLRGGVRNTTLTGYAVGSNAALAATDTVLGAFGKVQGQLNAKQNALTNPITGTGTTNFIPKFTGTGTIGNSALQEASGNLGLGVTPSAWTSIDKAIEIGRVGNSIFSGGVNDATFTSNAYYNINWKYGSNGSANLFGVGNGNNSFVWLTAPSGTAGNAITFTQAMTLGSNSGLSIGTTAAAPSQGLLVAGAATFSSSVTAVQASIGYTTAAPANGLIVNGNVGIGTSTPSAKLNINGAGAKILIQDTQQGSSGFIAGRLPTEVFLGNDGALPLSFLVNNTERLRITSAGNVGIGTTAPARLLHVAGAIRITATAAPATPIAGDQYFDSTSNRMRFRDGTSSWIDMGMFWESAAW